MSAAASTPQKTTRKAIGKQLNYLKRDLAAIDEKLNQGKSLDIHQKESFGDNSQDL